MSFLSLLFVYSIFSPVNILEKVVFIVLQKLEKVRMWIIKNIGYGTNHKSRHMLGVQMQWTWILPTVCLFVHNLILIPHDNQFNYLTNQSFSTRLKIS